VKVDNVIKTLLAIWRADRIIAEIKLRQVLVGLAASCFAALFAAFGVLMLELAAYFALIQTWTAITAAVALGLINFVLAGAIALVARRKGAAGTEYEMALALHSSAVETLQLQIRSLQTERAMPHGLEAILPSLVVPAIGLLVKTLRQRKAPPAP